MAVEELKLGKVALGKGAFASVYPGSLDVGVVAVKVLHSELQPEEQSLVTPGEGPQPASADGDPHQDRQMAFKLFVREALVMAKLRHSSIVRCYGLHRLPASQVPADCKGQEPPWAMVLERCTGPSLSRLLMQHMQGQVAFTTRDILSWLHDIAEGVTYLHNQQPCIVHRDLKCENVLLSVPFKSGACVRAKVTDLGLHTCLDNRRQKQLRRASNAGSYVSDYSPARQHCKSSAQTPAESPMASRYASHPCSPRSECPTTGPLSPFLTAEQAKKEGFEIPNEGLAGTEIEGRAESASWQGRSGVKANIALLYALSNAPESKTDKQMPLARVSKEHLFRSSKVQDFTIATARQSSNGAATPPNRVSTGNLPNVPTMDHTGRSNLGPAKSPIAATSASRGSLDITTNRLQTGHADSHSPYLNPTRSQPVNWNLNHSGLLYQSAHTTTGENRSPSRLGMQSLSHSNFTDGGLSAHQMSATLLGQDSILENRESAATESRTHTSESATLQSRLSVMTVHDVHLTEAHAASTVITARASENRRKSVDAESSTIAATAGSHTSSRAAIWQERLGRRLAEGLLAVQSENGAASVVSSHLAVRMTKGQASLSGFSHASLAERSVAGSEWASALGGAMVATEDLSGLAVKGLARTVMSQLTAEELAWVYSLTTNTGSAMYMAPEVRNNQPYNEKIDVFSFGVIAYELLARSLLVFSHIDTATLPGVTDPDHYASLVAIGYRPAKPKCHNSVEDQLWELVQRCWAGDPNVRPSMSDVVVLLEVMLEELERTCPQTNAPGGACCTVM